MPIQIYWQTAVKAGKGIAFAFCSAVQIVQLIGINKRVFGNETLWAVGS